MDGLRVGPDVGGVGSDIQYGEQAEEFGNDRPLMLLPPVARRLGGRITLHKAAVLTPFAAVVPSAGLAPSVSAAGVPAAGRLRHWFASLCPFGTPSVKPSGQVLFSELRRGGLGEVNESPMSVAASSAWRGDRRSSGGRRNSGGQGRYGTTDRSDNTGWVAGRNGSPKLQQNAYDVNSFVDVR